MWSVYWSSTKLDGSHTWHTQVNELTVCRGLSCSPWINLTIPSEGGNNSPFRSLWNRWLCYSLLCSQFQLQPVLDWLKCGWVRIRHVKPECWRSRSKAVCTSTQRSDRCDGDSDTECCGPYAYNITFSDRMLCLHLLESCSHRILVRL